MAARRWCAADRRRLWSLDTLVVRLDPADAARVAKPLAARMITETEGFNLFYLARALSVLAGRLDPADAAKLTGGPARAVARQRAIEGAIPNSLPGSLSPFSHALSHLAVRLSPADAAEVAKMVAVQRVDITATTPPWDPLTVALSKLAGRLDPADAAEVARLITDQIAREKNPYYLGRLVDTLSALAGRLDPADADKLARIPAQAVIDRLIKESPILLCSYYRALSALGGRLDPADAARAARVLADHMVTVKENYWIHLDHDAQALSDVAVLLGPADTAVLVRAPARAVIDRITARTRTREPWVLEPLSRALSILAGWLDPADAAELARKVPDRVARKVDPNVPNYPPRLAWVLTILVSRLGPADVADVTRIITDRIANETDSGNLLSITEALLALGGRLGPADAARVGEVLADHLVTQGSSLDRERLAHALSALSDPDLLAVLKSHGYAYLVRDAVLAVFSARAGRVNSPAFRAVVGPAAIPAPRPFTDVWEFVAWAEANRPDLDLVSRPVSAPSGK
jgi:hypothetical protein